MLGNPQVQRITTNSTKIGQNAQVTPLHYAYTNVTNDEK